MCGLAGILNYKSMSSISECKDIAQLMAKKIIHRGPDDFGFWSSGNGLVTFSHQRLSIQDLSKAGHQPMFSKSKNLIIEFNGEIYNHLELRNLFDLSFSWRGSSDTETLVALFEKFGVEKTLEYIEGMFVIALWDVSKQELTLIRDRFGEKPLYYSDINHHFTFASELKALLVTPWSNKEVDLNSLSNYFQHSFVPGANSIYKGIKKLLPGELLRIKVKNKMIIKEVLNYWSPEKTINQAKTNIFSGQLNDAAKEVEDSLRAVIKKQLIADVPVGIFLSGGVDSSLITLLAQQESSNNIKTFNVGFESKEYDESNKAKFFADEIGTDHTSIVFKSSEALSLVKDLSSIYDEPFADAAQMPTLLLSKLAKKSITVVLSGDGGDELFGGYTRYISGPKIYKLINYLPTPLKKLVEKLIRTLPPNHIDNLMKLINPLLGNNAYYYQLSRKLYALSSLLKSSNEKDLYNNMRFFWTENLPINNSLRPLAEIRAKKMISLTNGNFSENMMVTDTTCYLPDNICVKLDRATMANSLETRLPFLNHELFSLAWSLPINYKINDGMGKIVLRQVLNNNLPKFKFPPSKQGFSLPLASWLRNDLKEWASDLLSYDNLRKYDILDKTLINEKWQKHLKGKSNFENDLWSLLIFLEWAHNNKIRV